MTNKNLKDPINFDEKRHQFFPFEVKPGIVVKAVDVATVYEVTGKLTEQVFSSMTELGLMPFTAGPEHLQATRQRHAEQFVIYANGDEPIGWSIGEQRAVDDFFMTWTGIIPAYQNQGIYSAFLRHFISYCMALGYARITSNHMVNNRRVIVAKMKAGFIASGMSLDERIGAALWLTYYIDKAREAGFKSAFSLENYD